MEFLLAVLVVILFLLLLRTHSVFHARNEALRKELYRLFGRVEEAERQIASLQGTAPPQESTSPSPTPASAATGAAAPDPASSFVPTAYPPPAPAAIPILPPPAPKPAASAAPAARTSLEQQVGTNWLNRIGITLLVFGIAFFLAYQVTRFGPIGKVLASFAVAAVLLAGGLWLERKPQYRIFARAGIGGGWALAFLTTYAMYHFPATQVLSSELADLVLMFLAGTGMVVHSLRYRSQTVTGMAFLLAFSTVTVSQVTAYSLLASAVLALGLEIVCVREAWFGLEIAGIAAAYANHLLWLTRTLERNGGPGQPFADFWPSTTVLLLFWGIFRIGYVLRRVDAAGERISGFAAVLNAAAVLAVMRYQSFHPEWAFRALLALGGAEMVLAFAVRRRQRHAAFAVLVTIASVLLLAAIPFRYGGATWPILWIAEAEALFLCGLWLRERIMRLLGTIGLLLSTIYLLSRSTSYFHGTALLGTAFALAAITLVGNAQIERRQPASGPEHRYLHQAASSAGILAAMMAILTWVPGWPTALLWTALAAVLLEAGLRQRSALLRAQSYAVLLIAAVRLFTVNFDNATTRFASIDARIAAAAVVIAGCVFASERLRRTPADALQPWEPRIAAGGAAMAASAILSTLLYIELQPQWLITGWAALLLLQLGGAFLRDGLRVRAQALILCAMAAARALTINFESIDARRWPTWIALALLFAAVPLGFRLRSIALATKQPLAYWLQHPEQLLFFIPLALLTILLGVEFSHGTLTIAWCLLGIAVFLIALALNERSFRLGGLALLLLGVAKLLCWDIWQLQATERYLSLIGVGIALIAVSFLYSRYANRLKQYL